MRHRSALSRCSGSALDAAARERGCPVNALVAEIDAARLDATSTPNLTSAIRQWLFARQIRLSGPSRIRAWPAICASIGALTCPSVRARPISWRNWSIRARCSPIHASTASSSCSLPAKRDRNSIRNCSKSRARPAVSSRSH